MPQQNHAPEVLEAFATEHIPYELNMLVAVTVRLPSAERDQVITNAYIESFCTHLRVLDDFLGADHIPLGSRARDVLAVDFLASWTPTRFLDRRTREAVNAQVAHLSIYRVSGPKHPWHLRLARQACDAFGNFVNAFPPDDQRWAQPMRQGWRRATGRGHETGGC